MTDYIKEYKEKFEKWRTDRYLNAQVTLRVLEWDADRLEYAMRVQKIKRCEIPADAVHITGKKGEYMLVNIGTVPVIDPERCTAVDINLWLENNDINDALLWKYTNGQGLDAKKLLIIIGIGLLALFIWFTMSG